MATHFVGKFYYFYLFIYFLPCISIYPCNENQFDVIFIPSLFLRPISTCFGRICSPSSGGILYIYNNWYVLCFLVDCWPAGRPTDSQLKSAARTNCCIYSYSIPPDDGLQIRPKYVEIDWRNKLGINSAWSWFSSHGHFLLLFDM